MSLKWSQIGECGYKGQPRQGHTLTYIPKIHCLLLFGGSTSSKQKQIHLYDILSKKWKVQRVEGRVPQSRKFHAAHYDQQSNSLIIHGGQGQKKRILEDFSALFIEQWKWRNVVITKTPPARQMHSMTPSRFGLFIVGGVTDSQKNLLNDIWLVKQIESIRITNSSELSVEGPECVQIQIRGQAPLPRFGHRCSVYNDTLYLFGGQSSANQSRFSIYKLNLGQRSWKKTDRNCNFPQLSQFSMVQASASDMIVFGGVSGKSLNKKIYKLSLESQQMSILGDIEGTQKLHYSGCIVPAGKLKIYSIGFKPDNQAQFLLLSTGEDEKQREDLSNISMEEYLISIKNEQILSQELLKKNQLLEQLYLVMQEYITQLHNDYNESGQYDDKAESEKKRHIGYTMELKENYSKVQDLYKDITRKLKEGRSDLSAINEEFERCIQTEIDEDM